VGKLKDYRISSVLLLRLLGSLLEMREGSFTADEYFMQCKRTGCPDEEDEDVCSGGLP